MDLTGAIATFDLYHAIAPRQLGSWKTNPIYDVVERAEETGGWGASHTDRMLAEMVGKRDALRQVLGLEAETEFQVGPYGMDEEPNAAAMRGAGIPEDLWDAAKEKHLDVRLLSSIVDVEDLQYVLIELGRDGCFGPFSESRAAEIIASYVIPLAL
jgi:hypothetical protein